MQESLDQAFSNWLKGLASQKGCSVEDTSKYIKVSEIIDRQANYPALGQLLRQSPIDPEEVKKAGLKCITLGQKNDATGFQEFTSNHESQKALHDLFVDFPVADDDAISRIDAFIEFSSTRGYLDPSRGKPRMAAAASMTSTLLTAAFPKRFVDFRQGRWKDFSKVLGNEILKTKPDSFASMIIEAGHFAASICQTNTFKTHWITGEPLWTISGICMMMKHLK